MLLVEVLRDVPVSSTFSLEPITLNLLVPHISG